MSSTCLFIWMKYGTQCVRCKSFVRPHSKAHWACALHSTPLSPPWDVMDEASLNQLRPKQVQHRDWYVHEPRSLIGCSGAQRCKDNKTQPKTKASRYKSLHKSNKLKPILEQRASWTRLRYRAQSNQFTMATRTAYFSPSEAEISSANRITHPLLHHNRHNYILLSVLLSLMMEN